MASNTSRRTAPRPSRARSILSDSPFALTPHPTPPPPPTTRRSSTRGIRANSTISEAPQAPLKQTNPIPPHYHLPPTVPSPFAGTLEASLDAILAWGAYNTQDNTPHTRSVVTVLLQPVSASTNWPVLLRDMLVHSGRALLEDLLFLVTRTLLPEQIAENRAAMGRLYDRRKQLAIRLVLRYDMLREWREGVGGVASLPPAPIPPASQPAQDQEQVYPAEGGASIFPENEEEDGGNQGKRRPLMPNILATLIAAPPGGFITHGVRDRMKHHITELDNHLLLTDEMVARWRDAVLVGMASQIVLQWQWLRQNNEVLLDMEVLGWEELDGRADECEWIADDVKKAVVSRKEKEKEKVGAGGGVDVKGVEG